ADAVPSSARSPRAIRRRRGWTRRAGDGDRGGGALSNLAERGLARRLFSRRAGEMLARNTVVSCCVFAFDIALLWLLVERAGMGKIAAAVLAFVIANSLHYGF